MAGNYGTPELTPFAATNFRNQQRVFGIRLDDRRRHMYIIGKTGMGKTTLIENLVISDIVNGHGLALVDPHGDLVEKILDYIPSSRVNDVVYFNPADINFPVAFNVLESVDPDKKHLIASGLVGVFKKIYAESWGPRLEYLLRNAILALLDYPGATMLGIMRVLVDKEYRSKVIEKITDPVVRSFWVDEYSRYPDKFQVEAIAPIQNKVGQFLANSLIRNVVGQVKSSFNMREVMDGQKILLVNLAKGRVGEDTSGLLGSMIITKIQLAAMERVDIPEKDRKDFFMYVDEFQNFATDAFANILSEARKYRLGLIVAHQYIEQLSEQVAAAIFGNVGTLVCFRVGGADAEFLEKEFTPRFVIEDLVSLAKYDVYLKLMINGVASEPFSATTLPPLATGEGTGNREKAIRISRERYAKPREVVEEKIARWTGMLEEDTEGMAAPAAPGAAAPMPRMRTTPIGAPPSKPEKPGTIITCNRCQKQEKVFVDLDPNKPIYCKECLKIVKEEQKQQWEQREKARAERAARPPQAPRPSLPPRRVQPAQPARPLQQRQAAPKITPPPATIRIVKEDAENEVSLADMMKRAAERPKQRFQPQPQRSAPAPQSRPQQQATPSKPPQTVPHSKFFDEATPDVPAKVTDDEVKMEDQYS